MGVLALWESGHRGPVPVPVLVGVPAPTRPNTDQMREEAGRYQRRSAVVQERRPKPRRAAMGDAKAQTQVPTPADKNARTSKKPTRTEAQPSKETHLARAQSGLGKRSTQSMRAGGSKGR